MLNKFYKKINLVNSVKLVFVTFFIWNFFNILFSFKIFLLINLILLIHYISVIYFLKYEKSEYFPIMPGISLFFFSTYTLSFFIISKDFFFDFNEKILIKSIFILIIGLSSFFFGYFFLSKLFSRRKKTIIYFNFKKKQQFFILIVFLILSLAILFNSLCSVFVKYSFFKQLKEPIILFSYGLFLSLILKRNSKSYLLYFIFFLSLLILFLFEITTGLNTFIFYLIFFLVFIFYYLKKKIPIIAIFFIFLLAFLSHSFKYKLRDFTWFERNYNCIEKILIYKSIILNSDYRSLKENIFKKSESVNVVYNNPNITRLLHSINSLNIVSKLTPDIVPFFEGKSYKIIYTKFMPRDIFPNKPEELAGNFWGHRYFVLNSGDNITSWNFPVLNEFYANYGIMGVFFGMFFLGFFTKLLLLKLSAKNLSNIEMLVSSVIIYNLLFLEINLSLILGKIINQFIFFNIFFLFLYLLKKFISKYFKSFLI